MSITNNKNQNPLLDLLIDCMSAESAPKIMSLKDEYNLNFSNFLITGLCNSSANYWFGIILLLTAPAEDLFSTSL